MQQILNWRNCTADIRHTLEALAIGSNTFLHIGTSVRYFVTGKFQLFWKIFSQGKKKSVSEVSDCFIGSQTDMPKESLPPWATHMVNSLKSSPQQELTFRCSLGNCKQLTVFQFTAEAILLSYCFHTNTTLSSGIVSHATEQKQISCLTQLWKLFRI